MTPRKRHLDLVIDGDELRLWTFGHVPGPPVKAVFRRDSTGLHLVQLTIDGTEAEITSATLRSVSVARLLALARRCLLQEAPLPDPKRERAAAPASDPGWKRADARSRAVAEEMRAAATVTPRRGRPSLSDEHYEGVARDYLDFAQGGARGLLQRLADDRGVSVPTVRDWVHGARKRGFLTPGQPGRAGAEPGPRLTAYRPSQRRGKR